MQPDQVREQLEGERARLAEVRTGFDDELASEAQGDALGELAAHSQHQADLGAETFNRDRDLSILARIEAELDDVDHALRRLDEGTYGICEACLGPIGEERLEAMPAARFCVNDQSVAEVGADTPSASH